MKKIVSILLALALCLGMCPAWAAEGEKAPPENAVAKIEKSGSTTAYVGENELGSAFADSGNAGATFTLLADVERTEPLQIRITCVLDLGGHTICCEQECLTVHCDDTGAPLNVTIRGEGKVISTNNTALTVWGNVTLKGGTFTSNGGDFGGVYVNNPKAKLSVTGESVIIQNTGGGYGLAVNNAQSVQLSAGTYFGGKGSIVILNSFTLGGMLAQDGDTRYAYFNGEIPITGVLNDKSSTGTVTVKKCGHVYEYTHTKGTTTHSQTCPACGEDKGTANCDYGTRGRCACGSTLSVALAGAEGLVYNGEAHEPAVTVTLDGAALTQDNYTVDYADNTNAGTASVTVTSKDDLHFEQTVTFPISKITPTGAPKYTAITASGKTLADAGLTSPEGWPQGDLVWDLPSETAVTANTEYAWTFTPTDAANYNVLTGKIKLWEQSSGGSSGGTTIPPKQSVTTDTTQNTTQTTATPTTTTQGGTATATVSTTMGNEIVKQAVANRSEAVVIAPKTGNATKTEVSIPAATVGQIGTQTSASLTVSTSVADVTIPNGGLGSLASAGGTVTVTAQQVGNAVELTVTAGGEIVESIPGGLTLTVPATGTTPGTVAMLVREDGTREVVRKSVADEKSVTIPLDGSAKLVIVDNSKTFDDVPADSWAADAVAFASAHAGGGAPQPGEQPGAGPHGHFRRRGQQPMVCRGRGLGCGTGHRRRLRKRTVWAQRPHHPGAVGHHALAVRRGTESGRRSFGFHRCG